MLLPPGVDEKILYGIPERHKEDAVQEAWVGYLEAAKSNHDPIVAAKRAAKRYVKNELTHEKAIKAIWVHGPEGM